jgi:uncharacterized repeat protein (TIGR01451 family)
MRPILTAALVVAVAATASTGSARAQATTATEGLLKVCKVGGPGIPAGTPFTFTAGANTFTVPTGPAPGGTCVVGPRFSVGTRVTVAETVPAGYTVSSITVAPASRLEGTPNLAGGSVNVTIGSGVTEVTFTDKRTGFLEVCKSGEVQGNFSFTVNPGGLGPYVVPAGACSPAIEVAAGTVTIHELASAGTVMSGCSTISPAQQGACNLTAQTSTVTVDPGDVSTMTIAFVTNKKMTAQTGAVDVSLAKSFVPGVAATGAFTLTVKNEGAPIGPGTTIPAPTIRITDPVPAGVTLTGFGGTSGTSWSCAPAFPMSGLGTLTCTYTGTGTIASGALLPNLVLNATLALAGSQIGIYENCATVALSTAAGPVTESNTANNRSCAVTLKINPADCESGTGKCPEPGPPCTQDVLMVVDASLSIGSGLPTVKTAIGNFLRPMQNKGGRVNIFSFNNQPNWTPITNGWTPVTSANASTLANPIVLGGTRTNWDDALERAKNVVLAGPNRPLVLFITDGDPNASNNNPGGAEVDNTATPVTAAKEAVPWINAIRAAGSPIIAIGFGQVANAGYLDAAFTGNSSGPGNVNLETSSVIKMDSVDNLAGVLATLGNQMCGTLSLSKRISTGPTTFIHPVPIGATSVAVDDTIPFTLELTNNATTQVTGVEVQDQVPSVLTGVTVVGTPSIGIAAPIPPGPPNPPGNLIVWSGITLAGRQTATLSFTGKFVKTYPAPPVTTPTIEPSTIETYSNYAQVTVAPPNYTATTARSMNPVNGPVAEVDESRANFTEHVYTPSSACLDAIKPDYCYVRVTKVQNNPENCTSSPAGGTTKACQYTVSADLTSSNIPAGSTVTVADTFTVGGTPISPAWAATVPATFCPSATPTTVPFTCSHGSPTSFSGVVTVMIPPGQSGQLKNCITVTVANPSSTPPLEVSHTACAL